MNETRIVVGSGEKTKGWFVDAHTDWSSFARRVNWRDFCLVHLGGEWNHMTGRVEAEVCLLGLWLCVTYVYDDTWGEMMRAKLEAVRRGDAEPLAVLPIEGGLPAMGALKHTTLHRASGVGGAPTEHGE